MRAQTPLRFLCLLVFLFCIPQPASADTIIDTGISQDTVWTKTGSPYLVQSALTVAQGATLTIEPGVVVQFETGTWLDVFGRLIASGTSDEPILLTFSHSGGIEFFNPDVSSSLDYATITGADGITDYGSKELSIAHTTIRNGSNGFVAYGSHPTLRSVSFEHLSSDAVDISYGSTASLSDITLNDVGAGIEIYEDSTADITNLLADSVSYEALAVYSNSSMRVASSTIINFLGSGAAIEVFTHSSGDISNLTLDYAPRGGALYVFDSSDVTLSDSRISHTRWESIGVYDTSRFVATKLHLSDGTGDGVQLYTGARVEIKDSVISGFSSGAGIVDYGSWPGSPYPPDSLTLTGTEIKNNNTGLSIYASGSQYAVSQNSIHDNTAYGAESYGVGTSDFRNNYWGDSSGPYNDPDNPAGTGNGIYYVPGSTTLFSPWLLAWGALPPGHSNVLFLPGIEGSRLYRPNYSGGTDKVWEPNIDADVKDLYMNPDGTSVRFDVYTKEGDVINELPDGENIYKSFMGKMDDLKTDGAINDWEPIAYDWRLSLDDILNFGNDVGGRIYYSGDLRATSTPYIIQELKRLAATSKSGKVTIIAHSNGGLLAKRLTQVLGPTETARLIDKMIFVAVPQAGTPAAIAAGLHGYDQSNVLGLVTSKNTARTLAANSPMTYNLLPSGQYFTYVDDPVVTFDTALTDWISRYGAVIHSQARLHQFLTDTYGRVDAQTGDINQPIQLSDPLLSSAESLHTSLDTWIPPQGVQLTQIAGWGVPKTVEGVTYKKKGTGVEPNPDFTIDGDGTVVVPSALWMSTTTGAVNYWVDLAKYNKIFNKIAHGTLLSFDHGNILEVDGFEQFISDVITNAIKPLDQYSYLSTTPPSASDLRLRYTLHSPLTLNLYDDQGHHTGVSTTTGEIEEQIPGTYYTELGDVKYLFSDASTPAHVVMNGYAPGTFTFNVDEYSGDTHTASTTFKDIPTTASTTVSLGVSSDISTLSPMFIDKNGDGIVDATLVPKLNDTVTLDTTPPELRITFSTTTNALAFIATDDSGSTTITSTTTYPAFKKGEKEYKGIATTTVTARDGAGNTTKLIYIEKLPSPPQRDTITLVAIVYNGATTTLSNAGVSYKWRLNKDNSYKLFASLLRTASTTLESHYRPKKAQTVVMTMPQDIDDSDTDDDSDIRLTKQTLPGMVVPYMQTKKGSLIISY